MSTSAVAFDLRARPLPGPGGFALAFEACTFALNAVEHQPDSSPVKVYFTYLLAPVLVVERDCRLVQSPCQQWL
jgi:hypothetical protein